MDFLMRLAPSEARASWAGRIAARWGASRGRDHRHREALDRRQGGAPARRMGRDDRTRPAVQTLNGDSADGDRQGRAVQMVPTGQRLPPSWRTPTRSASWTTSASKPSSRTAKFMPTCRARTWRRRIGFRRGPRQGAGRRARADRRRVSHPAPRPSVGLFLAVAHRPRRPGLRDHDVRRDARPAGSRLG